MKSIRPIVGISLFLAVFFVYFVRGYYPGFGWTIALLVLAGGILNSLPKKLSDYPIKSHGEGYFLLLMGCLLALSHSVWDQKHFVVLNVLLIFPLIVAGGYALNNNISSIPQKLFSFFFTGLGEYFHSCFRYLGTLYQAIPSFKKVNISSNHLSRWTPQVGISILGGLGIIILIILPLLASADPIFSKLLEHSLNGFFNVFSFDFSLDWFTDIHVGKIMLGFFIVTITGGAMMLMRKLSPTKLENHDFGNILQQYYTIMVTMITVVYILFAMVQIKYLFFGGQLPEGITYSQYAVKGFRQLLAILSINVAIFVISPMTQEKKSYSFLLNAILFLTTCVIWVSCVMRLQLYIDVYQLTRMRLLPWTFSILLLILLTLVFLGTKKSSISRLSVCFYGVCIWYVLLNLVGVDWIIAKYNMTHTEEGKVDMQYLLNDLSHDVFYVLDEKYKTQHLYNAPSEFDGSSNDLNPNNRRKRQEKNLSYIINN